MLSALFTLNPVQFSDLDHGRFKKGTTFSKCCVALLKVSEEIENATHHESTPEVLPL